MEPVHAVMPRLKNSKRLMPVFTAIVEKFGGKLCTRNDINNLYTYMIMQTPSYNDKAEGCNFDKSNPANAKREAGGGTAVMASKGLIIPLS